MDKKKKADSAEDEAEVIKQALIEFDISSAADTENRARAYDDLQFLDGQQWPEKIKAEREEEGRPCLTFSRLNQFVDRVVGDQRKMRPSIKVRPVEGQRKAPKVKNLAGTQDYELSDVYEGLIRNIEYLSRASQAYDTASEHAAATGSGYFRITNEFPDDEVFDQDLRIKRIRNPFSAYDDPYAKEMDRSDRNFFFLTDTMRKRDFERKYPGKASSTFSGAAEGDLYASWFAGDDVRVSEYFRRVPVKREIVQLSDGQVIAGDKFAKLADEMQAKGITAVAKRTVDTFKVEWRLISGLETLEGPIELKTKYIPVVFVPGKELFINGKVVYRSIIRNSKDAQRAYNYHRSAEIETIALAPKAPYVAGLSQVEGLEGIWQTANSKNHGFLPYDDRKNPNPPRRELPPQVPTGMAQQSASAGEDIKATAGIYDASLGNRSNETSGVAIRARQQEADAGTFAYLDNLSMAIGFAGRILVDWMPFIYDTNRVLRLRWADDTEDFVEINQVWIDQQTGEEIIVNDLSAGKFDVVVQTGPTYATQRLEAADSMMEFAKVVPGAAQLTGDLIAKNMDWPGADEFAERLRKALPPGFIELEDDEEPPEPPPPPPPTPEQEVAMAQVEADMAGAEANMAMAKAKTVEAQARIRQAEMGVAQQESAQQPPIDRNQIRELVAESIAEFMAQQRNSA